VVLAAICWASQHWLLAQWAVQRFLPKLGLLLATVVAGALGFAACGLALGIEELHELLAILRRRLQHAH
jgi:hypothetical protein